MKIFNIKRICKSKNKGNVIILMASIVLIYLLITIYFANHFFLNTIINGVNVSLKAHDDVNGIMKNYNKDYKLQLIERSGEVEEITAQEIGMQYNEKNSISKIYRSKNSFRWIYSLLKGQKYYVNDLFVYNIENLEIKINKLNCLNKAIIEPQNVSFRYVNGSYEVIEEVYGNKINKDKLYETIEMSILGGETKLNLNEKLCYENPKYTLRSEKTLKVKNFLDKYVSTKIIYLFGNKSEILDGNIIHEWLSINKNLDVEISEIAVMRYARGLCRKYDTVGIIRNFKASTGKMVEVKGGLYGWKIDFAAETKALMENIKNGEIHDKEPVYIQRSISWDKDDIGDTYVEINITSQHLWFYKDGKLLTQGPVVTGDPNKGYSTVVGTYFLNYKQKDVILRGPDYETLITYWMPFFGNMGIHEARWRNSFGGEIYDGYGSHGCINTPLHVAKTIFDNIEAGTPIVCYEE